MATPAAAESPNSGEAGQRSARQPAPRRLALVVLGTLALVIALGAVGPGGASTPDGAFQTNGTNDTEEPTLGTLTKVDVTTLELEIVDNEDVDEDSIEVGDFELSDGTLSNVTANESGTNATVTLNLVSAIDEDELTVSVDDNATIADTAGWELNPDDEPSLTVDGMDGVKPAVRGFDVENGTGGTLEVEVEATEELSKLFVSVNGPDSHVLEIDDFSRAGFADYVAELDLETAGEYRVRVSKLSDLANNSRDVSIYETISVDGMPPETVASIDFGASEGLVFTFDAGRTTDQNPIRNYTWDFGDGSGASGERVSHRFEPGNYTITLEATDSHGNTGRDRLSLDLANHNRSVDAAALLGLKDVSISPNAGGTAAVVDVPVAPANETIELAPADDGPIAAASSVAVESMAVTLVRNGSYTLGVQVDGPAAVDDAGPTTNGSLLAGLTVVHDVPDSAVRNVTFTLAVDRRTPNATDEVSVSRFDNGSWHPLRAESLNGTNETTRYRVHSPELSRFAVAREEPAAVETNDSATATPTEEPATPAAPVAVTAASLNATAVDANATVGVSATVRNRENETAAFTAGLTVDGSVVATQSLSIPAGETRTTSFAYTPEAAGNYALAVNGTSAGTLEVAGGGGGALSYLGFLPLGLLRALGIYVGGALVAVFLLLKAAALYLGY